MRTHYCYLVLLFTDFIIEWITVDSKIIGALAIILAIFSDLIANFHHLLLVINSIKPKDHDWQKFIS